METYQILALNSGQPLILYQEEEKVYMYTVYSGRIHSHGTVFDDVDGNLSISSGDSHFVSYLSKRGKLKFYALKDMRFVELISFPGEDMKHTELTQFQLISFKNKILLFYLIHNLNDSSNSLFFIDSNSTNKSSLVVQKDFSFENFYISIAGDELIISIITNKKKELYFMDKHLAVFPLSVSEYFTNIDLFNENKSNKKDAESERDALTNTLAEKNQKIEILEQELYQKNNEISALKSTQKHITNQYNELADFAGKLQEELRKVRYL